MEKFVEEKSVDKYNLERFVSAQDPMYERVVKELEAGAKTSHWMWYIFPQIEGLGVSETSKLYAISGVEEAAAYLDHPVLGKRLVECAKLALAAGAGGAGGLFKAKRPAKTAEEVFGWIDDAKFRSSMTLFALAQENLGDPRGGGVFESALEMFFQGRMCEATLKSLGR